MGSQEILPTAQLMHRKLSIAVCSTSTDVAALRTLVSDIQKCRKEKKKRKKNCSLVSKYQDLEQGPYLMKTAYVISKCILWEPTVRLNSLAFTSHMIS